MRKGLPPGPAATESPLAPLSLTRLDQDIPKLDLTDALLMQIGPTQPATRIGLANRFVRVFSDGQRERRRR